MQPSGRVSTGTCTSLLLPGLFLLHPTSLMITGLGMASPRVFEPLDGLPSSLYPVREQVARVPVEPLSRGQCLPVLSSAAGFLFSTFPQQNMPISFSLSELSTHG